MKDGDLSRSGLKSTDFAESERIGGKPLGLPKMIWDVLRRLVVRVLNADQNVKFDHSFLLLLELHEPVFHHSQ